MLASRSNRLLDVEELVELDGTPTNDPEALARGGALRTWGGRNGFSLAALAELCGSVLTGAAAQTNKGLGGASFKHAGMLIGAISTDAFTSSDAVMAQANHLREAVHALPSAPGYDRVLLAGDPEIAARIASPGVIKVSSNVWDEVVAAAST